MRCILSNKIQIFKNYMDALNNKDLDKMAKLITDDFVFSSSSMPEPMPIKMYLSFLKVTNTAFGIFEYNHRNFREVGETVVCDIKIKAKHTGELAMSGQDPIPATNKVIELPTETISATFKDDKISKLEPQSHTPVLMRLVKQIAS